VATVSFTYRNGATNYSRTFTLKSIKGYDEPDQVEFFPPLLMEATDGALIERVTGFRRVITITFGVLQSAADRAFVFNFLANKERWITMSPMGSVVLMLADPAGFANEWKNGRSLERRYTVTLRENVIHTTWPAYADPEETETLYIKSKVEITGTEASPQTLVTNAGSLATDDTGNPYPAINLAAYAVTAILSEHQECLINRISDITQSGSDISFTVARSYAGGAYADGKYYATITIGLQAK